jgi:serine/threonine-protein kinase
VTISAAVAVLYILRRRRIAALAGALSSSAPTDVIHVTPEREAFLSGGADPFGEEVFSTSPTGTSHPFGGYSLEALIGRGAMGSTWRGKRLRDGVMVAVKVPHTHVLENEDFAVRFQREGALGSTLHHPNIVQIFEAGHHEGKPFIAMELLQGETLEKLLKREGRLEPARALGITRQIALALDYTHMKGIVHRDLKPDNVMITLDGMVKVMDYGIARQADLTSLTGSFAYLGTPLYSAPESVQPQEIDPRSDLYSLGIILYRMLVGRLPFVGQHAIQLLHLHATAPLPPFPAELGLAPEYFSLVFELTAKAKDDRFPSAEYFLRELDRVLNRG